MLALIILVLALQPILAKSKLLEQLEECRHSDDCSNAPFSVCGEKGMCQHKEIYPFLTTEVIGIITLPILLGLANIGGIGGGGMVIPLAIGCWGF